VKIGRGCSTGKIKTTTTTQRADAQPCSHHKENNRTLTDYSISFKKKKKKEN
jgi:hypothetical protein